MANFNTHLSVAAVASGMLATLCLQIGFVDAKDAFLLAALGVIGGILPDIDLHYSYPSRILFSILGIVCAFLWIFAAENDLPIVYLWAAGLGIYLIVRFPFWSFFQKVTVHRGSIHSLISATLFSFITVAISYQIFDKDPFTAWIIGLFMFFGFLLHLVLDEIYSVDFMGRRLKRSFGSALKLFDKNESTSSFVIIILSIVAWYFTPNASTFFDTFLSTDTYRLILSRIW